MRGLSQDASGDVVLGDIILSVDGTKVNDSDDVFRLLDKKQVGDTIQVEIFRNSKTLIVPVKLLSSTPTTARPARRIQ